MKTQNLFLLLMWLTISGYCQYPFENLIQTYNVPAGGLSGNNPQAISSNDSYLFLVKFYDNAPDTVYVYEIMTGNLMHAETMSISGVSGGSYGVIKTTNDRLFCGGDFYSLFAYDISDIQNWNPVDSLKSLDKGFLRQWDNDNDYIAWGGHWAQTYQVVDISSGMLDAKCKVNTGGNNYMGGRYQNYIYVANAYQQNKRIDISDPQNCTTSNFGNSKSSGVWVTESGFVVYHANYLNPARIAIFDQNNNLLDELVGDEWTTELLIDNLFLIINSSTQTRVLCDISDSTFSQIVDTLDYYESVDYCYNDQYLFKYDRDDHNVEVYFLGDCNISINLPDTLLICQQDSIILDAGAGFVSYLWSTGDNTQTMAVFETGTYTVTVEDAFGCTATDSTYVNIINAHIAQNDTTICAGESIELSVTGGSSSNITDGLVAWYPFNGNANDESDYDNNGVVNGATLTTDRFGLPNSSFFFNGADAFITVNDAPELRPPVFSISIWVLWENYGTDIIDFLIGKGMERYEMHTGGGSGTNGLRYIPAGYPQSAVDVPTIFNENWNHIVVTYNENISEVYFNGQKVGENTNISNPLNLTNDPTNFYFGRRSDGGYLFNGKLDDIRIYNRVIDTQEVETLYSEGPSNYSYLWSTGDTTASIIVTPTQTTTYYVEISDGINWCTDSVTVNVNEINLNLPDTLLACQQDSIVLDAGAGFVSYLWSTSDNTQTLAVYETGTYAVTVEDAFGCTATDSTYVNIINAHIAQNDTTICAGESIELAITGDTNNCNYIINNQGWLGYSDITNAPNILDNDIFSFGYLSMSNYSTLYTKYALIDFPTNKTINGFKFKYSFPITIPSPCHGYNGGIAHTCKVKLYYNNAGNWLEAYQVTSNLNTAGDPLICEVIDSVDFDFTSITAKEWRVEMIGNYWLGGSYQTTTYFKLFEIGFKECFASVGSYSYLWSTSDTTSSITVTPTQTTTYYVEITDGINWCTDSVTVNVNEININLPDTLLACRQDSIVLDAGAGFVDYLWSTGDTTQTLAVYQTGTFGVTVEDTFGCTATDSTYVNIINAHIAQNDTTICAGESIELSVTGGGSANITDGLVAWYPFNGNAEDKSGYENHGTVVGASLVTDRFGFPNSAYDFNGIDNHITFNSPVATGSVPISFTFWAQSSYSGGHDIMGQFTGSDSSKDVRIQFSTPQIAFKGLSFKNPVHFATAPSEKVHDSNWHHYAMVMGENNNYRYNNIKFYVDGELIPIGYGHNWGNWTYSLLDENFNIGKQGGGCGGYYNGVLDDIKIFNKAINPEEIQLLYQEGTGNYSYLWSTGDTTASITVTPTQTTTYYVEITDGINWCTDSVTVTVENAVTLDLKVNLEGPWFSGEMTPFLNVFGFIPLSQPYSGQPWNYAGTESVTAIPNPDVIDWVLVELRETTGNPSTASSDSLVGIKAGFLLKDGSVTAPDGVSDLVFSHDVQANLYAVVWHRNHLGIMSNYPLVENSSIYSYDFTISGNQVYGGSLAHKEVSPGIWAMVAADGNADRQVNNNDKNEVWASQAGLSGYYPGDFDMNSQVDNSDKNDLWVPNSGRGAQVPDFAKAMSGEPDGILKEGYKCMVPE